MFLSRLGRVLRGGFQFRDALRCDFERVLLHEHGLRQNVRGERRCANGVVDESLGLRIARGRAGRVDSLEQTSEHLTFFGSHNGLRFGP